jgi:hypothetical protein
MQVGVDTRLIIVCVAALDSKGDVLPNFDIDVDTFEQLNLKPEVMVRMQWP